MAFMVTFSLLFLFIFVPMETLSQRCISAGDLGEAHCVLLAPYYFEYQWAICLTNDYIMRSASVRGKTHFCLGHADQCWYQCMAARYDRFAGHVNAGCRCSPSTTLMPTMLRPRCFSPRGNSCKWYRKCLEVRYNCRKTKHDYAIKFGEKFCKLYSTNYNDFSSLGQSWIDAVRKCLQVKLVPYLWPWVSTTCKELHGTAFKSHTPCYLSPDPANKAPSICDLSCADIWKVFWLVAIDGEALKSEPLKTIEQMLDVAVGCFTDHRLTCLPTDLQNVINIGVRLTKGFLIQVNPLNLAGCLIGNIAAQLGWNEKGFGWFPFLNGDNSYADTDMQGNRKRRDTTDFLQPQPDILSINILLVDLYGLNISNHTTPIGGHNLSLEQAINELALAVSHGSLSQIPLFLNDTELTLDVLSVGQCIDFLCNSTNLTILSTAPTTSPARITTSLIAPLTSGFTRITVSPASDFTRVTGTPPTSGFTRITVSPASDFTRMPMSSTTPPTSGFARVGAGCLLHQMGMICLVMIIVMFMYH